MRALPYSLLSLEVNGKLWLRVFESSTLLDGNFCVASNFTRSSLKCVSGESVLLAGSSKILSDSSALDDSEYRATGYIGLHTDTNVRLG